jgi:hypothetical protein
MPTRAKKRRIDEERQNICGKSAEMGNPCDQLPRA